MSLQAKYNEVLELGKELGIADGYVNEENGVLKVGGKAAYRYHLDSLWNKIKEVGGQTPADIQVDLTIADESVYAKHTVKSGDSLSKIAKHYYGDEHAKDYMKIFNANTGILKDPNMIHPGQELVIPHF
ncbi:MAG: LysM peptidoglycan-binding domain-containing protein [Bacteroidia bacterium]|nr:LysM peptidoglycan-binding domain-containing protein [Bacteroidia bacterium]